MYAEKKKRAKAWENVDYHYLQLILKDNWVSTPTSDLSTVTDNDWTRYDATVSNGKIEYKVELKGRDYKFNQDSKAEGLYIDKEKVDNLVEIDENAFVIAFLYKTNEVYVWRAADCIKWKHGDKMLRKNNTTEEKSMKEVYYLPMLDGYFRWFTLDMSDYYQLFLTAYNSFSEDNDTYPFNR